MCNVDWRSPADSNDVNADGFVTPVDALLVINDINTFGSRVLPKDFVEDSAYVDASGDQSVSPIDALLVINHLNTVGNGLRTISEGGRLGSESEIVITLGQESGQRIYRAKIDYDFDAYDSQHLINDVLSVYLVDAADPSQTILDRGTNGTSLFTLSALGVELVPGVSRWDGEYLELDLSSLKDRQTGILRIQLVSGDVATGARITVSELSNRVEAGELTTGPIVMDSQRESIPGPQVDLVGLSLTQALEARMDNLRYNRAEGQLIGDLVVRNLTKTSLNQVVVVFGNLPEHVSLLNFSGLDSQGRPYINLSEAFIGNLDTQNETLSIPIVFMVSSDRFTIQTEIFAAANNAPVLPPLQDLVIKAGQNAVLKLAAQDADQDDLEYSVDLQASDEALPAHTIDGTGELRIFSTPQQVGNYRFEIVVSDGTLAATQSLNVRVVADTVTTTRVAGRLLDTSGSPIQNMMVEIGAIRTLTLADGTFLIDLGALPIASDTLKIRGDLYGNGRVYPFIAERLELLLEHDVYPGVMNGISRSIYLPVIDVLNGKQILTNVDTSVTTGAIPGIELLVRAGTLFDLQGTPFNGLLTITEVPVNLTPAALPSNLYPDLVVTIQPGEMTFATPAPLNFPNRSGAAPGTVMDLWSINPATGAFDDVGDMVVSNDGQSIITTSGGVRNSSWHFPARRPTSSRDTKRERENQDQECNSDPCNASATSSVELHSGALREQHSTVSYQSQGSSKSFTLHYNSEQAYPRPIVHFGYDDVQSGIDLRLVARLEFSNGTARKVVPGYEGGLGLPGNEHFWRIPTGGGNITAALQGDLSTWPTGVYQYSVTSGILQLNDDRFTGSMTSNVGQIVQVNDVRSSFGAGWQLADLQFLYRQSDGSILLVTGDGQTLLFAADPSDPNKFLSPVADYSSLVRNVDGTYTRVLKNQTTDQFDSQGKLVSQTDTFGNRWGYEYTSSSRIARIIDPVGNTTLFSYSGNYLETIIDPTGRTTRFTHDSRGDLVRIEDPDGSARNFEYDSRHRLLAETNQLGFRESVQYGFHGRVVSATRKDGVELQYSPLQTIALRRPSSIDDPIAPASVRRTEDQRFAQTIDGNGAVRSIELDQAGQLRSANDAIGNIATIERNSNNLISSVTDGRGFRTDYSYDTRGNLTSVTDQVIRDSLAGNTLFPESVQPLPTARKLKQADFNGDGIIDFANVGSDTLSIIMGKGDGTFSDVRATQINSAIFFDFSVLDFDQDQFPDIALVDNLSGDIVLMRNDGEGGFVQFQRIAGGSNPYLIASADINNDTFQDLIRVDSVARSGRSVSELQIYLGGQAGAFTKASTLTQASMIDNIELRDLSGDNTADMILDGHISLGTGSGLFTDSQVFLDPLRYLVIQDIDGDNDLDLAYVSGSQIRTLINGGSGLFSAGASMSIDSVFTERGLFGGDFNSDGSKDLGLYGNGVLKLYIGNGSGTFTAQSTFYDFGASTFSLGNHRAVQVADINGDQLADIVVASEPRRSFAALINAGNGVFDGLPIRLSGSQIVFASGDLDGDGDMDFIRGNPNSSSAFLFRGKADGTFASDLPITLGVRPTTLQAADVNNDGLLDILVTRNANATPFSSNASLHLGTGQGSFSAPFLFALSEPVASATNTSPPIQLADLDRDGDQDLIFIPSSSNRIIVRNYAGNGLFDTERTVASGETFSSLAIADVNRDGNNDIVAVTRSGIAQVIVYQGDGQGNFTLSDRSSTGINDRFYSPSLTDLNSDGVLDLVLLQPNGQQVLTMLRQSNQFSVHLPLSVGGSPHSLKVGDLNRDGYEDLFVANQTDVSIYLSTGAGAFDKERRFNIPKQRATSAELADLNNDSYSDALIGGTFEVGSLLNLRADGPGGQATRYRHDPTFSQLTSEIDELGHQTLYKIDPATGARLARTQVADAPIDLQPTAARSIPSPAATTRLLSGDLDGDGFEDVVTFSDQAIVGASVQYGSATGLGPSVSLLTGSDFLEGIIQDFNGDLKPDLAILSTNSNAVHVLLNSSNRTFAAPVTRTLAAVPTSFATTDMDSDGDLDLLVVSDVANVVFVLSNQGAANFTLHQTITITSSVEQKLSAAWGDFNRDGRADIAVGRRLSGSTLSGDVLVYHQTQSRDFLVDPLILNAGDTAITQLHTARVNDDTWDDLVMVGIADSASSTSIQYSLVTLVSIAADQFSRSILPLSSQSVEVEVGDFDTNGRVDFAALHTDGKINVQFGNGRGDFRLGVTIDSGANTQSITISHFGDRDRIDLLAANGSNNLTLFSNILWEFGSIGGAQDLVTKFEYSVTGQLTRVTDPRGFSTVYSYDAFDRLISETRGVGTADESVLSLQYNSAGNPISFTDGNGQRTEQTFDAMNRLTSILRADPDGSGPLNGHRSTFTYDARGNLKVTTEPLGKVVFYGYDSMDRLVSTRNATDGVSLVNYDNNGNATKFTDENNVAIQFRYDARNRRTASIQENSVTSYRYDANNFMTSMTDPLGHVTRYQSDSRGRLVEEMDPLGNTIAYAYNPGDLLTQKTDRNGLTTRYRYDAFDRRIEETWAGSGSIPVNTLTYAYDRNSNLIDARDAFSHLGFEYDALNRTISVTDSDRPNGTPVTLEHTYDDNSNVLSTREYFGTAEKSAIQYTYDAISQVSSILQSGAGLTTKRVGFTYNDLGQIATIERSIQPSNPQIVARSVYNYDTLNRVSRILTQSSAGAVLSSLEYQYDAGGRLTQQIADDQNVGYQYDKRDQVIASTSSNSTPSNESFQYDANGNRLRSNAHDDDYVLGGNNRLQSDGIYDYQYDKEGNTVKQIEKSTGTERRFTWDHRNRLVSVTDVASDGSVRQIVNFVYDAFDRRILKRVDSSPADSNPADVTHFFYDREDIFLELRGREGEALSSMTTRRNLHGPGVDAVLAIDDSQSGVAWYLTDRLGSVDKVIDSLGQTLRSYAYSAFGQLLDPSPSTPSDRYLFAGREFDAELNLYYNRSRYYNPSIGRFVSEDSLRYIGQSNPFHYVQNSPTNAIDPSGRILSAAGQALLAAGEALLAALPYIYEAADAANSMYDVIKGKDNLGALAPPEATVLTPEEASYYAAQNEANADYARSQLEELTLLERVYLELLENPFYSRNGVLYDDVMARLRHTRKQIEEYKDLLEDYEYKIRKLREAGAVCMI